MKRVALILAAVSLLFVAGCSKGQPRAVTPETEVDFGKVPVVNDMSKARIKEFFIRNEGTADLRITEGKVVLLDGC